MDEKARETAGTLAQGVAAASERLEKLAEAAGRLPADVRLARYDIREGGSRAGRSASMTRDQLKAKLVESRDLLEEAFEALNV